LKFKLGWKDGELWTGTASLDERARALIEGCVRHGTLPALVRLIDTLRPAK
jgi:hypothetical protein